MDLSQKLSQLIFEREDGCWEWLGYVGGDGYGRMSHNGAMQQAHRLVYLVHVGEIPENKVLDHTCHTRDMTCYNGPRCPHRRCVNPDHLEPVAALENKQRSHRAARRKSPSIRHQKPDLTRLLSEQELADYCQAKIRTVRSWRTSSNGPPVLWAGGRPRYRKADVDAWLERSKRDEP